MQVVHWSTTPAATVQLIENRTARDAEREAGTNIRYAQILHEGLGINVEVLVQHRCAGRLLRSARGTRRSRLPPPPAPPRLRDGDANNVCCGTACLRALPVQSMSSALA